MKAKFALLSLLCVAASGCATVDLANVAGTSAVAESSASPDKENVVKRAASKLYAAFTTNGWVANKNRKRVQSAASVLLRGLDATSSSSPLSAYNAASVSQNQIYLDIQRAQSFVSQATKAAEVYLAMAPDDTNLREELASLQEALIASREAQLVFKAALAGQNTSEDTALVTFVNSVDALRDVTDAYGDRVRSGRTLTSALQDGVMY